MDNRNFRKDVPGVLAVQYLYDFMKIYLFLNVEEHRRIRALIKQSRKEKIYLERLKKRQEKQYQRFLKSLKVPTLRLNLNKDIKQELKNLLRDI